MRRLAALLLLLSAIATDALAGIGPPDTVVVVVRHAEKATDDPKDPSLSEAGQARAQRLADALKGLPLQHAISTQYKRTHDTAAPAARANDIEVHVKPVTEENSATYARDAIDCSELPTSYSRKVHSEPSKTLPSLASASPSSGIRFRSNCPTDRSGR